MKKMKLIHSALTVGILGLAALAAPLNANATSSHKFFKDNVVAHFASNSSAGYEFFNGNQVAFKNEIWNFKKFNSALKITNGCPAGTRHYRTNGLFGLGARDIGCLSAYEAESLRRQNYQNIQNNINRNRQRHCTTNFIAGTAYTNCY